QCSTIVSPSNTPSTVLVFPMSIVSSIAFRPEPDYFVVNEAGATDPRCNSEHRRTRKGITVIPNGAVVFLFGKSQIVQGELAASGVEHLAGRVEDPARAIRGGRRTRRERVVQDRRHDPLRRGKVFVPARQGEAVSGPYGGHRHDRNAQREVGNHPADKDKLLGVFLAEDGDIGTDKAEQL